MSTIGIIKGTGTAQEQHNITKINATIAARISFVFFFILVFFLFGRLWGVLFRSLFHVHFLTVAERCRASIQSGLAFQLRR